jgi:DNA-binding LacI/PurR family transcriptional regulator
MSDARPTIRSVAEIAGVSHQTVSRVLNGHPSIRPETRARVLDVIGSVGYRRSGAAVALATRRTRRLGVLVDSAFEYGPNATLHAVEQAARAAGYGVVAAEVDELRSVSAHDAVEHLIGQGVDALCVVAPRSSSVDLLREAATGLPTLVVKPGDDDTFLTLSVDQHRGAELAVQHLIDLGHRDIRHVAGPSDWLDARERDRGWRDSLTAAGLPVREPLVAGWTADDGYAAARALDPAATAVFAANDRLALGLMHGLADAGVRVPADVSVVGFDDIPDARHFLPPLTTVRQDFAALGARAVGTLLAALDGPEAPHHPIAPELVVRATTAVPRPS